jgi:hypothetical protein
MRLTCLERSGSFNRVAEVTGGRELANAQATSTVVVEAAAVVGPDLAVAARMLATELFMPSEFRRCVRLHLTVRCACTTSGVTASCSGARSSEGSNSAKNECRVASTQRRAEVLSAHDLTPSAES